MDRIPVTMVVGLLAENLTVEGVPALYPQLTAQGRAGLPGVRRGS